MMRLFLLRRLHGARKHTRSHPDIRIGEENPPTARLVGANMERVTLADPTLRQVIDVDDTKTIVRFLESIEDGRGRVRRTVVYDNECQINVLRCGLALNGLFDSILLVSGRDDHRHRAGSSRPHLDFFDTWQVAKLQNAHSAAGRDDHPGQRCGREQDEEKHVHAPIASTSGMRRSHAS